MSRYADSGETLIEILMTVMITGLTITALVSGLATAGNAANAQRSSVTADAVLRSYAEAIKDGARSCTVNGSFVVAYAPPAGYTVAVQPSGGACPSVAATQLLRLDVTGPQGRHETMQIRVRTP